MKKIKALLWVLRIQFKTSKLFFIWKLFYSIYDGLGSIAYVYFVAQFISSVTRVALDNGAPSDVYIWLVLILVSDVIREISSSADSYIGSWFFRILDRQLDNQMMTKMYSLSQEQFEDEKFNTTLDRARDGLFQTRQLINEVSWLLSSFVRFIGSSVAIIALSPLVGMAIIVAVVPPALLQARQNRVWEKAYKEAEPIERITFRTRWLLIDPVNMVEVRLLNGFKGMLTHWLKNREKMDDIYLRAERKSSVTNLTGNLIEPFVYFGALLHFFKLLASGVISLERFLFIRGLLEQAVSSVGALARSYDRLDELFIGVQNFSILQDTQPTIPDGSIKLKAPLEIVFSNVSFTYPNKNEAALEDVNLHIKPGDKVAVVGENGAGKTTLIKLLLRQYLPTSGTITVNGHNISELEIESYYQHLSNLPQESTIVHHLTIKDNMLLGLKSKRSDEDVHAALSLAGADEFVKKLKHGVDSRMDSSFKDGVNLSGGQYQRLAIARALLRRGDLMILDEPTSAIDAKAEQSIFNNIYKTNQSNSALIVSHRFSTVRKADHILVMESGKITSIGSHSQLLNKSELYKTMFEAQAEGYR